jgi:hypothetical protein
LARAVVQAVDRSFGATHLGRDLTWRKTHQVTEHYHVTLIF